MRKWLGAVGVSAILANGCALTPPPHSARELVRAGNDAGLTLHDPLALDREIRVQVETAIGTTGSQLDRMHRLRDYFSQLGSHHFHYAPVTYDANQAFREGRGDCMAFTLLFVALARDLDLPVHVVHVSEVKSYYERAGGFFVSSHVAVGYGSGFEALVIDLSKEVRDWQLAQYEAIDDAQAAALFYNNVAVDHMLQNDLEGAERMLTFLHGREPGLPELTNNLGVLLNREHRYGEALSVLDAGLSRRPSYQPFYTNAINAARSADLPVVVADLERRGAAVADSDPFFLFARGMTAFQADHFAVAAAQLERAADAKPDSPVILAWLTRAYLAEGDRARGRSTFERARRLAPNHPALRELSTLHPELR